MSKSVSSTEIEDVLSSIRRLVANDQSDMSVERPEPAEAEDVAPAEPEESAADALVLTPSLRVNDTVTTDTDASEADDTATLWDEDAQADAGDTPLATDAPVAPEPAALERVEDSPVSPPMPEASPFLGGFAHRDLTEDVVAEVPVQEDASSEGVEPEDALPAFVRASSLASRSDDPAPEPTSAPEGDAVSTDFPLSEPDPEGEPDPEPAHARNAPRAGFRFGPRETEIIERPAQPLGGEDLGNDDPTEDPVPIGWPETVSDTVLNTPQEQVSANDMANDLPPEEPLPDLEPADALPEAEPLSELLSGEPEAELREAPEEEDEDAGLDNLFSDGEGALIDEAALRELVVEIVHRELQGKLGERITRNVRKLVRREIQRTLASNEFD